MYGHNDAQFLARGNQAWFINLWKYFSNAVYYLVSMGPLGQFLPGEGLQVSHTNFALAFRQ